MNACFVITFDDAATDTFCLIECHVFIDAHVFITPTSFLSSTQSSCSLTHSRPTLCSASLGINGQTRLCLIEYMKQFSIKCGFIMRPCCRLQIHRWLGECGRSQRLAFSLLHSTVSGESYQGRFLSIQRNTPRVSLSAFDLFYLFFKQSNLDWELEGDSLAAPHFEMYRQGSGASQHSRNKTPRSKQDERKLQTPRRTELPA